jgi:hypothetical protein
MDALYQTANYIHLMSFSANPIIPSVIGIDSVGQNYWWLLDGWNMSQEHLMTSVCSQVILVQGNKIQLTLKPALLASEVPPLCRFEDARPGMLCEGVVTLVLDTGLLLTFYGDVKGLLRHKKDNGQDRYFIGQVVIWLSVAQGSFHYTGCFKKSFTTLKAYINLFRGHVQCFELS